VVGRVSMDMIGVDATDLPELPLPGAMAEIIGKTITVDDHADVAGTLGYEVLTNLKGRYVRQYVESVQAAAPTE
ncbi:MAG: hypothetical protein EON57_19715, partial [Alphaproteobacteria bacterium]